MSNIMNEFKFPCKVVKECYNGIYDAVLLEDGTVYIENGEYSAILLPLCKMDISDVKDIQKTDCGIIALKKDGTAYAYGVSRSGELGIHQTDLHELILEKIPIVNVKKVICKGSNTVFLKTNGTVYGCGNNIYGQLGIDLNKNMNRPTKIKIPKVKDIACTHSTTLFLLNDGTVYSCGDNTHGQLGTGGWNEKNPIPTKVKIDLPIKAIACSGWYSLFELENGDLYGCGHAKSLGFDDNKSNINVPILLDKR